MHQIGNPLFVSREILLKKILQEIFKSPKVLENEFHNLTRKKYQENETSETQHNTTYVYMHILFCRYNEQAGNKQGQNQQFNLNTNFAMETTI